MVKGLTGVPADIRLESFPDPGDRFTLGNVIGTGVSGTVYEAIDTQAGKNHLQSSSKIHSEHSVTKQHSLKFNVTKKKTHM